MSMTSSTRRFQLPFSSSKSKRTHGADASVFTNGSHYDTRTMSLSAMSAGRARRGEDEVSDRSDSLSVDLDDEGHAPAPPDLIRRQYPTQATSQYACAP